MIFRVMYVFDDDCESDNDDGDGDNDDGSDSDSYSVGEMVMGMSSCFQMLVISCNANRCGFYKSGNVVMS